MSLFDDLRSILEAGRGVRVPPPIGVQTVSRRDRTWLVGVPFIWPVDPRYGPTFQSPLAAAQVPKPDVGPQGITSLLLFRAARRDTVWLCNVFLLLAALTTQGWLL
jgi:hypothetical protein